MDTGQDKKNACKSAPAGGRKNSIKRDTATATKEINNWIHKGNKDNEMQRKAARNFNLLTENITEERMLYARQLELGRERYKFLANHDYEKQKFLERQTIKEKMMKKFMSSARKVIEKAHSERPRKTLTVRIPQATELSPRDSQSDDEPVLRVPSTASRASRKQNKQPVSNVSSIDLRQSQPSPILKKHATKPIIRSERRDTSHTRKLGVLRSDTAKKRDKDRPKTTSKSEELSSKSSGNKKGIYVNTSKLSSKGTPGSGYDNTSKLPEVHAPYNGCMYSVPMPQKFSSLSPTKSVRYKENPASVKRSNTFCEPTSATWLNTTPVRKFGERFDTSIGDPRYLALTSSLIGVAEIKPHSASVRDIIAGNEVLRSTSKSEGAANAKKLHAKFIALILEKEFK